MRKTAKELARSVRDYLQVSSLARYEMARDRRGLPSVDCGAPVAIEAAMAWLKRAQDCSASADGGVARDFDLSRGWAVSYPESTGYIIPTFIEYGRRHGDADALARARRMLDWLVGIQFAAGGFMGGKVDASPVVPVTFNTGQILLGLAAGVREFGDAYRPAMLKAADWLRGTQDDDGCWRRYPTPFAKPGDKTYETHVSWALFEAARVVPERGYAEAGLRQVRWALCQQQDNGWLENCCLSNDEVPLTHTFGYALRGFLEAHRYAPEADLLQRARRTADGLLSALQTDGFLPGMLDRRWQPAATFACLTGTVQIAHSWLMLYELTGERRYIDAARCANAYVRRTMYLDGRDELRGGVKGSFPVNGGYGRLQYPNWPPKFLIDSCQLELDVLARS